MYSGTEIVDLGRLKIHNPIYKEAQPVDERTHATFASKPDLEYGFRTQEEPRKDLVVPLLSSAIISLIAISFAKYVHMDM